MSPELSSFLTHRPLCQLPEKDCLFRCIGRCCHASNRSGQCPLFALPAMPLSQADDLTAQLSKAG